MDPVYTIRKFSADDVPAYKAMRLEALHKERGMFGNSYELEAALTDQQWLDRVQNPEAGRFGLYANNELIGITGIITESDEDGIAYMTQSYIRLSYRGKGLSRLLYEARMEWARKNNIRQLIIGHRKSNLSSKFANQRYGFVYTHSKKQTWPDGITEDMLYYKLDL